jgi:hypothetical protein
MAAADADRTAAEHCNETPAARAWHCGNAAEKEAGVTPAAQQARATGFTATLYLLLGAGLVALALWFGGL